MSIPDWTIIKLYTRTLCPKPTPIIYIANLIFQEATNLCKRFSQKYETRGPWPLDRSPESWHRMRLMHWPVVKEISFKNISIFSAVGHVVQPS